ncbi:MAG: hypothetical protein PHT88_00870 [Candidatus Moranbacteria bacterium]|nr:hypothetical protein [Candidatus Moranbacteria bacterium]
MKMLTFVGWSLWNLLIAIDSWLIRYFFQPFMDAGYESWSRRGRGMLVFHTVGIAVISFMIPVVIDEHESLLEIGKALFALASSVVIVRFVLLRMLQLFVRFFYGDNDEIAKFILFDLLKTVLVIGIFCALAFDIGDIFLTVSMLLFLCAVFFECCEHPQRRAKLSRKEHIRA